MSILRLMLQRRQYPFSLGRHRRNCTVCAHKLRLEMDWTRAHESAQKNEGPEGAWVHAYLHRKEGDNSNGEYWYRHARKTPSRATLEREWVEIAESLLQGA